MTHTSSLRFSQQIYVNCIRFITKLRGTPSTLRVPPPPHQRFGLQPRCPPPPQTPYASKSYVTIPVPASKNIGLKSGHKSKMETMVIKVSWLYR